MPGTATLAALEASALVGRGLAAGAEARRGDALDDYLAAERRVPKNPLVAYLVARTLQDIDSRLDTPAAIRCGPRTIPRSQLALEELPRWERAAGLGHEPIRSEARKRAEGVRHWLRLHPPSPAQPIQHRTIGRR